MIKLIKEHYTDIISMVLFGGTSLYCFLNGNNNGGFICLFFLIIVYLLMEILALRKQVGELELKLFDLDIKIDKVKWNIKD